MTTPTRMPLRVVAAAIVDGHRVLVTQRSKTMPLPLKWELPGGKVRSGESARSALRREIREELGIDVEIGSHVGTGSSSEGGRPIVLEVYLASPLSVEISLTEHSRSRWMTSEDLDSLDWAAADRPVLPRLATILRDRDDRRARATIAVEPTRREDQRE